MKTQLLKIISLIYFSLLYLQTIQAQGPDNGNRYNLFMRETATKYNPDGQNGTNYITFLMDAATDSDLSATWLHNTTTGSGWSHEVHWDYDTPETRYDATYYRNLLEVQNTTKYHYDFSWMAFQNNCGSRTVFDECCGFACLGGSDEGRWNYRSFWNVLYQLEPGNYYGRWHYLGDNNDVGIHTQHAWRYAFGERVNPLAFGTLAFSDYHYHTNYNRDNPTSSPNWMGYHNQWGTTHHPDFDNSRDITYSFTVSDPSFISIGTYSATFDTRYHLVNSSGTPLKTGMGSQTINYAVEPGSYYVVIEGESGEEGKFSFYLDNTGGEVTSGTIVHPQPWVKEGCTLTIPIVSDIAPTSSFVGLTYQWQQKIGADDWEDIDGATNETLTGNEVDALFEDTEFRRITIKDEIQRFSNEITFKVVPLGGFVPDGIRADGIIRGKITGKNGIGNVPGVTVYAVADPPVHGDCESVIYSDVTDSNGNYEISGLYYGRNEDSTSIVNATYRVYPVFNNHIFNPEEEYVNDFWSLSTIKENIDFEDITTLFIKGNISQFDGNDECPVEGVQFYLNNILNIETTDENGDYEIAIEVQGEYELRPHYNDHSFSPMMTEVDVMETDVLGVDFIDDQMQNISGYVWACGMNNFGSFTLAVEDTLSCYNYNVDTDANGFYSIDVSARAYYVSIIDAIDGTLDAGYVEGEVLNYFNEIITLDATLEDVTHNFIYKDLPEISIVGLTPNACNDIVLAQGENTWININITEINTGGCPLDTGTLVIIDDVSDLALAEVPISNGVVNYEIKPGEPNLETGHVKTITFKASHIDRDSVLNTVHSVDIIVTGAKSRIGSFTTVSPEIPLIILRDPPGDGSYAELDQEESTEISMSISTLIGGSVNVWKEVNTGARFEAGFLGFSTETEITASVGDELTLGLYNQNQFELGVEITNKRSFKTSALDDPKVMGQSGDLYVGAAISLKYAKADIISYDEAACIANSTVELIMGGADTETQFAYTEFDILTDVIPDLEEFRDAETDQTQIDYWQNQINAWNQMVDQNQLLKDMAVTSPAFTENIQWSGGGIEVSESLTTTMSDNLTIEFQSEIESSIATELGLEVAGAGVSGGVNTTFRLELGVGTSTTNTSSRTTAFTLTDDDSADRFETGIKMCPVYKTPVFDNLSAITSCPYETGTSPVDGPSLTITPSIQSNINPASAAEFNFRITNLSQDEQTRSYLLNIVDDSNTDAALINPGGDGIFPIEFSNLSYGEFRDRTVFISKQASSTIYSYEGLEFIVYPAECNPNGEFASDTDQVSVYFTATCSDIAMQEPQEGWLVNDSSNDNVQVHLKDYAVSDLNQVIVQYTESGLNLWSTALLLDPGDLNSNSSVGTFIDWDVSHLEDGEYDIRIKLNCTNATIYTPRVSGSLDRQKPMVLGIPYPLDDTYEDGVDEISIRYTESIDCGNVTARLINIDTEEVINSTIGCASNLAELVPVPLLESLGPAAYRVTIEGIEDLHGNEADPYSWVFLVGEYVYNPDCSPIVISNNNINQNGISQSTYSSVQISTDGTVLAGSVITLEAEENVEMLSGFEVDLGATYIATIEECEED